MERACTPACGAKHISGKEDPHHTQTRYVQTGTYISGNVSGGVISAGSKTQVKYPYYAEPLGPDLSL